MVRKSISVLAWVIGVLGLALVIVIFRPPDFESDLRLLGIMGAAGWVFMTVVARLVLIEATVRPINTLGYHFERHDAFWIGWVRTFANQFVPFSGTGLYIREIVRKTNISWSEVTSMATPQVFLVIGALGLVGSVSVFAGSAYLGKLAIPVAAVYLGCCAVAFIGTHRIEWFAALVPTRLSSWVDLSVASFRKLAANHLLVSQIVALNCAAILIRGCRIWLLFHLMRVELDWQQVLLIVMIAESATILQLTPTGLGLREGAIVGASALVGVSPTDGARIALIDRLFMIALTTLLILPALAILRRSRS